MNQTRTFARRAGRGSLRWPRGAGDHPRLGALARALRAEDELNAAVRRAELLLAAGGDPHRPLDPFGRAATALAEDLDAPERRAQLRAGLESLRSDVAGLRGARESLGLLLSDDDVAWQSYATALLAEALADE